jgi:L-lactate dehydrogenase
MLPLGGRELGHKGFSLALIVEALTSGLAGRGRSERPSGWTASVFVQLIDADAFGGRDAFVREMQYVADLCHETPVATGNPPVRLPGEGALARRRRQIREGVQLHETILPALKPWAERFGIGLPQRCTNLE